ncbi:MAG: N-acetylglucosamine kinase [Chitinophagia bacterium]|nr:N-acetylglucosamine kinase [Chitinophagia bacterium]
MLSEELPLSNLTPVPDKICYYGAGAAAKAKQVEMAHILKSHFGVKKVEVNGDMLAAGRALCGDQKGIVCILGTGSSSGFYDGKKIKERQPSLGYIAGDEGSGNHMGKRVLQYYTYGTFDTQLRMDFEMRFGNNIEDIVRKLYHEPYPNRYLATFVALLKENRGHYMVENIIEDCLNDFFTTNILKYRQSWKNPLYFTGSVAWYFHDMLESLCQQYELDMGVVTQSPMEGLIRFHEASLKES